jgi:gas vesicle protein
MKRVEQLKKEADNALRPLRQMVENLLKDQGIAFKDASLKANEGKMIQIDDATRAEAQRLVSDDGEYGVEQTSNRLLEFAKAISGDDKTKFDQLKSAIEEGFSEAKKAWGGELPDICQKTIDSTLEKLDKWANSKE